MSRRVFVMLTVVALMGVAMQQVAQAADAAVIKGKIKSISEDGTDFVLATEDENVTVKVNDDTKYTINDEEASKDAALKRGAKAKVTVEDGVALKVEISK